MKKGLTPAVFKDAMKVAEAISIVINEMLGDSKRNSEEKNV